MKYLVTGGAGFIGSNLAERLVGEGHRVVVVDNLSTGHLDNLRGVRDDIEFFEAPSGKVLQEKRIKDIDGIFHFGIPSSTPLYRDNPRLVGEAINDFIAILELAKREDCKLVYASSSSVYNGNPTPFREDMPVLVKDLYTEARHGMERLSSLLYDWYKVKSVGLRFFSVYGPHEESKKNFANLVTQFLWAIQKNEKPVVFGDGEQTRDFTYVKDIVEGNILAMESPVEHGIFNLGSGNHFTVNEMIGILSEMLGKKVECQYVPNPLQGYVFKTLADTSKAEKVLGFKSKYTLERGLKEIIDYYK